MGLGIWRRLQVPEPNCPFRFMVNGKGDLLLSHLEDLLFWVSMREPLWEEGWDSHLVWDVFSL